MSARVPFDLTQIRALSFDCYGTLIDWERGLIEAFSHLLAARGMQLDDGLLLETFAEFECEVEAEAFQTYRAVLGEVLRRMGEELGFVPSADECTDFAASVAHWPAFEDSSEALTRLQAHFDLIILSNVDKDLFRGADQQLGVSFKHVFVGQDIGSYKPDARNFEYLKRHAGAGSGELLHVAQSLFHDIGPARAAGLATVWVNRRVGLVGLGATPESKACPDVEVHGLAELANLLLAERG